MSGLRDSARSWVLPQVVYGQTASSASDAYSMYIENTAKICRSDEYFAASRISSRSSSSSNSSSSSRTREPKFVDKLRRINLHEVSELAAFR